MQPRERSAATSAVLSMLSDLAPDRRQPSFDVSGSGPTRMAWLGLLHPTDIVGDALGGHPPGAVETVLGASNTAAVASTTTSPESDGLVRYDALSPGVDDLRAGWLWVVGQLPDQPGSRFLLPILGRPVRARSAFHRLTLIPRGPWDLWPLVEDPERAAELERAAQFGGTALTADATQALVDRLTRLRGWVNEVLTASGLPPVRRLLAPTDPSTIKAGSEPVAVVGYGLYADASSDPTHPRETLAGWAVNDGVGRTAFASLYLGSTDPTPAPIDPASTTAPAAAVADRDAARASVASPLPLTDRQADVVLAARTDAVTVVSGPPGTGKSQTAAAIALDAVAHGRSVLVATQSSAAADVLAELLDRVPGPTPVLFGGGERASLLAAKLADGLETQPDEQAARDRVEAERRAAELSNAVLADLGDVAAAEAWAERSLTLAGHALTAPRLLDADGTASAKAAGDLLARARRTDGWWARRRARRAEADLRTLVGAPTDASVDAIADAVELAQLRDRSRRSATHPPEERKQRWQALGAADRNRRLARARAVAAEVQDRADRDARRAVAALATALRAGRATRRAHLARIDVGALTDALPLWVGTLGDIESMLPATPAAFDLVILDEASQIDQLTGSGALLRAARCVVIGDPRQLRFVSFLADANIAAAVAAHGLDRLGDRLDLRRVSAFDLAAGAAPVTFLDEHFRSVPHLIGFSARRFYEQRLLIATRHPANECLDAIEVHRSTGTGEDGANRAEGDAVVARVERFLADPSTEGQTIGVISPNRNQVDWLREEIGRRVPAEVLQSGRIRLATVHGFQGAEADVVVASFVISDGNGRSRRFLEDPNLFNVLVTRARRRLEVVTSLSDPPPGLVADYLRWAEHGPAPQPDGEPENDWTARLAAVLGDAGVTVRLGYPAGRWTLDLVAGDGTSAVAVATTVHPDGPGAHIRRHLALARAGWRQSDAFAGDHDGDAVAAALALRTAVDPGRAAGNALQDAAVDAFDDGARR